MITKQLADAVAAMMGWGNLNDGRWRGPKGNVIRSDDLNIVAAVLWKLSLMQQENIYESLRGKNALEVMKMTPAEWWSAIGAAIGVSNE